jgi:hypothetical protein
VIHFTALSAIACCIRVAMWREVDSTGQEMCSGEVEGWGSVVV